ncbi:MAG: 50S ribosomal protein L23 [Clostridia bacterium]|nr:50S ribosomal protein L23 [Clostridia bacterium]MBR6773291.1 50S ribosomal protein L23 [Clostridia bacterium]
MNAYDIIKKPLLSEKSYDGIASKKYVFVVDERADKTQIKAAVEQIFGVEVEKVNVVNVRGKYKRQGRTEGYTSKFKKAYVKLTEKSKTIEFFDSLA